MDRQSGDAAVLQLGCQVGDDEVVLVPAEARLHRHRQGDRLHDRTGDLEESGHIAQET